MMRIRSLFIGCGMLFMSSSAFGQGANAAAAEALYQEGRALQQQGKYPEACVKLAESQRLDPATGTLLALAVCHEAEGKLATAWAEFNDAEARARRDGREDREQLAREHIAALRPRLSTLTIEVPAEVAKIPGLEVRLNGGVTGAGSFGVAVPVDGGEHRVEASAPGHQPWSQPVSVAKDGDRARVSVPMLVTEAGAAAPAAPTQAESSVESNSTGTGMRTAGLVTAGAGIVALGVGSVLALSAKSDYDDATANCPPNGCPDPAYSAAEDARSLGTVATVVFVVGAAAVATGAVLWFVAPKAEESPRAAGLHLERVGLGPSGVSLRGSF